MASPEVDPFCDESNPIKIKYDDVLAASRRIAGTVKSTPCPRAHMSDKLGIEIYFKLETMQYTGSFKERGIRNTLILLSDEQKRYGAITASLGNHALATAYHCQSMDIPCILVMPHNASITKVMKCERFAAKIVFHGTNIRESRSHAMQIAREKKMVYINGYDHPNVVEGQGSIGIEILKQVPNVDAIIIPVGGGGLIAGIAVAVKYLKPDTEVYGCETDKTCSMTESLRKNERIFMDITSTIADGLAVGKVGVNAFHTIKGLVDKMVVVREDWVARTIMHVLENERLVFEGAGATGLACVMAGLFPNLKGKNVVVIASGGNIAAAVLARATERGMASEGRLLKFRVTVSDRPGGIADLCAQVSEIGAVIRDCQPERTWVKGDIFSVEIDMIVEIRGWDQLKQVVELIKKNYTEYFFVDMRESAGKAVSAKRGPCLAPNAVCMQKG